MAAPLRRCVRTAHSKAHATLDGRINAPDEGSAPVGVGGAEVDHMWVTSAVAYFNGRKVTHSEAGRVPMVLGRRSIPRLGADATVLITYKQGQVEILTNKCGGRLFSFSGHPLATPAADLHLIP